MTREDEPTLPPPPAKKIITGLIAAAIVAGIVLVTFILPSEYGVDPTGIGGALGLTQLSTPATRTIEIADVTGGNEAIREIEIPEAGEPVPLPNPDIYQTADMPPASRTLEVTIPAEAETEVKTVLQTSSVITFNWSVDRGTIYSDFHGHDPAAGPEFWVRYREHQEGGGDAGSLVAPFDGEHGWYWLNYNDHPVTVTLTVTGYYDDIIDYGIF